MQPASLHSRVLTSVTWEPRPPSPWGMQAGFGAAVTAAQVLAQREPEPEPSPEP